MDGFEQLGVAGAALAVVYALGRAALKMVERTLQEHNRELHLLADAVNKMAQDILDSNKEILDELRKE